MDIEQRDFFQWEIASKQFQTFNDVKPSFITVNPAYLSALSRDDKYWNPLKNADVVFVRCVRPFSYWKHYEMASVVKSMMRPDAKMIFQDDMDFLWLYHQNHCYYEQTINKTPDELFRETKILEIADAFNIEYNPLFEEEVRNVGKPVYHLLLPQLVRYKSFISTKPSLGDKGRVVLLIHSVKSASINHVINNLPEFRYMIFMIDQPISLRKKVDIGFGRLQRDNFMEFLKRGYIAIDDNEGYYGWSRFAMECALVCVPCIGSTPAVQEFFPELYTKPKDYKKQRELAVKLFNDKKFWLEMATEGKRRVLERMDTRTRIAELVKIIKEVYRNENSTCN